LSAGRLCRFCHDPALDLAIAHAHGRVVAELWFYEVVTLDNVDRVLRADRHAPPAFDTELGDAIRHGEGSEASSARDGRAVNRRSISSSAKVSEYGPRRRRATGPSTRKTRPPSSSASPSRSRPIVSR